MVDTDCLDLYRRHYSARSGQRIAQFVGPGEHIVLRTERADALFVWRRFIDDSGQTGVNCSIFRNESKHQSSELVRQADAIADFCWPDRRHYCINQEQFAALAEYNQERLEERRTLARESGEWI